MVLALFIAKPIPTRGCWVHNRVEVDVHPKVNGHRRTLLNSDNNQFIMPVINLHQVLARSSRNHYNSVYVPVDGGSVAAGVIVAIVVIIFLIMWYVLYQDGESTPVLYP